MRHLTIRLQLAWLTVVALAAFVLMAVLQLDGAVDAQFASTASDFRRSLGPAASIDTFNLFRAQLAADMLFLLAYGLLLRQSVIYLGRNAGSRRARHAVVVAMLADATENVCALYVLRTLTEEHPEPSSLVFMTMNAAAMLKWFVVGLVLIFLAAGWRRERARLKAPLRSVGGAIALAFAVGALGSLLVAFSPLYPPLRSAAKVAVLAPAVALLLQFRLLDVIGLVLRFLYLARVPLIVLFLTAAFGPIALGPGARLLGGILDVATPWGIAVVTAASLVLAFACATQINLVRAYGWQRTFDITLRVVRHRVLARAVSWTALCAVALLLFSVALASLRVPTWQMMAAIVAGVFAGVLFVFLVELAAAWLADAPRVGPLPQLGLPFARVPLLGRLLNDARHAAPPRILVALKSHVGKRSIAGRLFGLSSGYIELDAAGRRRLLPGHTFAIIQLLISTLFYIALVRGKLPGDAPAAESGLWVPTAGSVVLLLQLAGWGLAAVTFFLDRYRMPLFTAVFAIALVTGGLAYTDYEAATDRERPDQYVLATPGQVLQAFPEPLVVAAAGGGIQAGAWTARVLEGINEQMKGTLPLRVALVSGVSGGSMGALYYGVFQDTSLSEASRQSMEPSLDEIASALIGADLLRIIGIRWGLDRGAALERSWALRLPTTGDFTLRGWAERVRRVAERDPNTHSFPAFLFNTTIVETGQPMAFATTQFPTMNYRHTFSRERKQYPVVESANGLFELSAGGELATDVGLQAVSAARLSAAFPYVSPAATLDIEGRPRYHLVDGGYYDNFGLVALSQWLDDALGEMAQPPTKIGVLIIRGLVGSDSAVERDLRESEERQKLQVDRAVVLNRGWAYQVTAPPAAFLNTRTFGQWAGGNQVLKLLVEKWAQRNVTITPYLFDYPVERLSPACRVAPLSWKLSAPQQTCIHDGWRLLERDGSDLWNPGT